MLWRVAKRIPDLNEIASVPVIIAPNRRSTDRQIAGRHVGTPVLPWQAENRASFILDKLAEGYDNDQLRDELNFTLADIQSARQTRAIADMVRSLDLPEEIRAKLDNPRAKIFSTIGRVFDNTVDRAGRDEPVVKKTRSVPAGKTVLPKSFKVRYGNDRLKDIRSELVKLNRELFPNAGAVLLRFL